MTHDPLALIIAAPVTLAAIWFGVSGYRLTARNAADKDADEREGSNVPARSRVWVFFLVHS